MIDSKKALNELGYSYQCVVSDLVAAREEAAVWKGLCIGLLATLAGVAVVAGVGYFII